jgi:hypothetical protein
MDDIERGQCEQYSRILFGKLAKGKDFEDLIKGSFSYHAFRIQAVQRFANKNETTKKIVQRWQGAAKPDSAPDATQLLQVLEGLVLKHTDLDRVIREAGMELLDRFKTLDTAATGQAIWRAELDDIRRQMAEIRSGLENSEEVPGAVKSRQGSATQHDAAPDANLLLHVLEKLVLKHTDLERKMRDSNVELLEKFKTVDTAATALAAWRTHWDDMRIQISGIRGGLENSTETPSRAAKGPR